MGCLESHFLGLAPWGSTGKCFAVLKSGLKEVFKQNYETCQYGNEPLSSHKFAFKLPCQSGMFRCEPRGSGPQLSPFLLPCNCSAVEELHQVGCCITKGEMLALHRAPSMPWVGNEHSQTPPDTCSNRDCFAGCLKQPWPPEMKGKVRYSALLSQGCTKQGALSDGFCLLGLKLSKLFKLSGPMTSNLLFPKFWL